MFCVQVYINLLSSLGPSLVFALHAVFCLLALFTQQLLVPETRGKNREQIQRMFDNVRKVTTEIVQIELSDRLATVI